MPGRAVKDHKYNAVKGTAYVWVLNALFEHVIVQVLSFIAIGLLLGEVLLEAHHNGKRKVPLCQDLDCVRVQAGQHKLLGQDSDLYVHSTECGIQ